MTLDFKRTATDLTGTQARARKILTGAGLSEEFKPDAAHERILAARENQPAHYERLAPATRNSAEAYERVKAESELPDHKRPIRRRNLNAIQKAALIRELGATAYNELPM